MNVLITGGSGFVGRNVAARLQRQGCRIRAVSRCNGCDFQRLQRREDWLPWLAGVEAVVNCVGIIAERRQQSFAALHTTAPIALFQACEALGVRRVIQISALGADESAFAPFHLSKRAADQALQSLALDWLVLRPSLIYGRGGGSAELFLKLAALPLLVLPGHGRHVLQPIHIRDVAEAVTQALTAPPRQCVDLAGGESFTLEAWLQRMRQALGLAPAPVLHLPMKLCLALSRLLAPCWPLAAVDNLRMLAKGYACDARQFVNFVGRSPLMSASELFFSDALETGSAA